MMYQLPDCGPKGMARLNLYYLGIFPPGLFCSHTLLCRKGLTGSYGAPFHHLLGRFWESKYNFP